MSEQAVPGQNWYDGVTGFFGLDAASTISGRKLDPLTGRPKANFGDTLLGRSQAELDSAYDQLQTTRRRTAGKEAFEESGYSAAELGIDPEKTTRGQVSSAIRRVTEQKADEKSTKLFKQSLVPLQLQSQQQTNEFNATMQRAMAQDAKNYQLQLLQMADTREANAQALELQRQQMIREDQRYNERMEQLDRKDRKAGRQSLVAGLAALGAAFAL